MSLISKRKIIENQLKANLELIEQSLRVDYLNDLKNFEINDCKIIKENSKENNDQIISCKHQFKNEMENKKNKIGNKLNDIKFILSSANDWSIDEPSLKNIYTLLLPKKLKDIFGQVLVDILENIYTLLKKNCQDPNVLKMVQRQSMNNQIFFKIVPVDENELYSNNSTKSNKSICNLSFESGNLIITFKSIKNINDQIIDLNIF
ncbi:hypothetical protein ACTA71_003490 [Dictyostelium dimigraforme]